MRHLVDLELASLLDALPPLQLNHERLAMLRAAHGHSLGAVSGKLRGAEARIERNTDPPLRVLIYRPRSAAPTGAILYMHGGGFVLGRADDCDAECARLTRAAQCVVVSVDYRLAPEAPFPAALEDCYAALIWLSRNAVRLNVDATRIAVMGRSAGGGLAAGLALLARDRDEAKICHQHLLAPMLDDRASLGQSQEHLVWTVADNAFAWRALLGVAAGGAEVSPYAAPARASDQSLEGLPQAFIAVGALDLFVDANLGFAERLRRAGVNVETHVFRGAFHGFELARRARVTRRYQHLSVRALSAALKAE